MKTQKTGIKDFINQTRVNEDVISPMMDVLSAKNNGKMPTLSDMVKIEDGKTYQYVNYVQEGGGMLGVALVGYTYVLEKMGIRFLKLAGTSAGAINTMLLAAVDKKNYTHIEEELNEKFTTQSELILYEMLNYDLWNLVDGSKFGKWLIATAIKANRKFKIIKKGLLVCIIITAISALLFGIGGLAEPLISKMPKWFIGFFRFFSVATFIAVGALGTVAGVTAYYLKRFSKSSFGLNPGRNFTNWMTDILFRNGIESTNDLNAKMEERFAGVHLSQERKAMQIPTDDDKITPPFVTIIASDITNQNKVEFPLMAGDYWTNPGATNPAEFVRASMSIPVFFEPFKIDVTKHLQNLKSTTQLRAFVQNQYTPEPKITQFVDGGILSNFPINVFHNPSIAWARMPTFGIKLQDETHLKKDTQATPTAKSKFGPFLSSILSTIRFYYDRDFLKRNMIYEKCIAHIDVAGFNWLDFGMDNETKKKLFMQGAMAAKTFFLGSELAGNFWVDGLETPFEAYDWEKFKQARYEMLKSK
jgi:NTE family protein